MFLNLYSLSDGRFRDHNFSDFWNDAGGGGDPIEQILNDRVTWYLQRSYLPDSKRPERVEGLPPDFYPIFPLTLSHACCESFVRSNPSLPIAPRDYYLSKLFQFIVETLKGAFQSDPVDKRDVVWELHSLLDRIPKEMLPPDARVNWVDFWWDLYADTTKHDLPTVLERLTERVEGVVGSEKKRRYGPKPQFETHIAIKNVVNRLIAGRRDWRDEIEATCTELDRANVPVSKSWTSKAVRRWSEKLKQGGGKEAIVKVIQYSLGKAEKYQQNRD